MKIYLVGAGKVGLLRSFMYCQSTLCLCHKTADRSSIYWSQCIFPFQPYFGLDFSSCSSAVSFHYRCIRPYFFAGGKAKVPFETLKKYPPAVLGMALLPVVVAIHSTSKGEGNPEKKGGGLDTAEFSLIICTGSSISFWPLHF